MLSSVSVSHFNIFIKLWFYKRLKKLSRAVCAVYEKQLLSDLEEDRAAQPLSSRIPWVLPAPLCSFQLVYTIITA